MIDPGIEEQWHPDVLEAIARFKQGDIVERPPFFYAAKPAFGIWDLTRAHADSNENDDLLELVPEDRPPYGLITTQTCDLAEEGRKKKPWVQIAPVYNVQELVDPGTKGHIRKHRIGHLMKLSGTALPDGFWVADFRIEFPVEKSWLVGLEPIAAFSDEAGYLRLAQRLAGRLERPAFGNTLVQLVKTLKIWLDGLDSEHAESVHGPVSELRLAIEGDRIHPTSARLMVLTDYVPLSPDVREHWDEWWDEARHTTGDLVLLGNRYETLRALPAMDYIESVPLNFNYLSPEGSP